MYRWFVVFSALYGSMIWGLEPSLLRQTQSELKVTEPFMYTGMVQSSLGTGSGVVVGPSVYATAAHIYYNESMDEWAEASTVEILPVHHKQLSSRDQGIVTAGYFRWDEYAERSLAEDLPSGVTSLDTFNLDFIAAYSLSPLLEGGRYSRVVVDEEEKPSLLRSHREKTIVGYPAESTVIPYADIGKMHWTEPGDYGVFWMGWEDTDERDSDGYWTAVYTIVDVITYGGNSGGPVFVKGDDERWYLNAILDGGSDEDSLVRGVDENAWTLIESANEASGSEWLRRIPELEGTATGSEIRVGWSDESDNEVGYRIERRESNGFISVGEVGADVETFVDTSVQSGKGYQYRVIPIDADGNEGPAGSRLTIETTGGNRTMAEALGVPLLAISTGGESSAYALSSEGVQTGDIEAFERSFVELKVEGPGYLKYTWKVSSEVNPYYGKRQGRNGFNWDIFDAFYCYRNDVQLDFISGIDVEETNGVELSSGVQTIRWEYAKDAYSDEGEDAGVLKEIEWTPYSASKIVYGGIPVEGTAYYWASWFGYYTVDQLPWSYHYEWGWLRLAKRGEVDFWAYSPIPEIGWIYIQPERYPVVYSSAYGWMYYFEGTGVFGTGQWIYLYEEDRYIQL